MKITNPGEGATNLHNLNDCFALLFKIDCRIKQKESERCKAIKKAERINIASESIKNNEV
jgi:hypothetical protein